MKFESASFSLTNELLKSKISYQLPEIQFIQWNSVFKKETTLDLMQENFNLKIVARSLPCISESRCVIFNSNISL